jgi:hypothetical protein
MRNIRILEDYIANGKSSNPHGALLCGIYLPTK